MRKILTTFGTPARLWMRRKSEGPSKRDGWRFKLAKFVYNTSGYNKYGLYTDDLLDEFNPVVKEALNRLPKDVTDARNFRLIRAMQLDFLETYLPREKWITYEQDLEYRYLGPYMSEIMAEKMEIHNFGCTDYYWGHLPPPKGK